MDEPEIRTREHGAPARSPYDAFAGLAACVCDAPVGIVSRIDPTGAWFDAFVVAAPGAPPLERSLVFRETTASATGVVAHDDGLRSYAGLALTNAAGRTIGTLAALDASGRTFAERERTSLRGVGAALAATIDIRHTPSSYNPEQIAMLGKALELVADPIAIFQRRGVGKMPWFVYVNRAFTELFGYTMGDVIGKEPKILTGPETGTEARSKILAAQGSAPIDYGTLALYTASGERLLVEMVTHHLHPSHRTVSYRDVTRERSVQASLADANLRLQSLVSINSDPIFTFDAKGTCLDVNPAGEAVTGKSREELLRSGLDRTAPGGFFPGSEAFPRELAAGRAIAFRATLARAAGETVDLECNAIPIAGRDGVEGAYVFAKDVTERKRLAALVREQAERATALCAIAALTGDTGSGQVDAALALVLESFGMHYAYVAEIAGAELEITNRIGEGIYRPSDVIELARAHAPATFERGDVLTIDDLAHAALRPRTSARHDGFHAFASAPLYVGDCVHGWLGFVSRAARSFGDADRDFIRLVASLVSSAIERREQNRRLDRLAYYDSLSGLPNRIHFRRRLAREVEAPGNAFALHFVDLDGFKGLNDRAGHAIGDLALRETSRRLERICRRDDMPARLGGDEFVVLQTNVRNRRDARAFGERIVHAIGRPYAFDGEEFGLGASVGVALFPEDARDADTLMRRADAALYRAKSAGKRRVESGDGFEALCATHPGP